MRSRYLSILEAYSQPSSSALRLGVSLVDAPPVNKPPGVMSKLFFSSSVWHLRGEEGAGVVLPGRVSLCLGVPGRLLGEGSVVVWAVARPLVVSSPPGSARRGLTRCFTS